MRNMKTAWSLTTTNLKKSKCLEGSDRNVFISMRLSMAMDEIIKIVTEGQESGLQKITVYADGIVI
jgi:hypothetical protein